MYPTFLRIGNFEITSFGVLVALGALAGMLVFQRELRRAGLPADAINAALAGVLGGLAGAKLIWAIEFRDTAPFFDLLLSRGGLSWFGGFAGGVLAGLLVMQVKRLSKIAVLAAAAPALADDAYRLPEEYVGRGGFSWIHRWSKTKGLTAKGEPDPPAWVTAAFGAR